MVSIAVAELVPGSVSPCSSDGRIEIVARDAIGPRDVAEVDDAAEHHHVAGGVAGAQPGKIGGLLAERQVGLRGDVIGASEDIEVVDIGRAEIGLDRVGDVLDRHAELLRLDLIDVDEHLRRVRRERREHRGQSRRLARRGDEFVGCGGQQLGTAALPVLDAHGEAAAGADAGDRGRRDHDDEGAFDGRQPLAQIGGDLRLRSGPSSGAPPARRTPGTAPPQLLAWVRVAPDRPATTATRMMPGVSSAMFSISRTISVVRASEAAPGNCAEMMT